MAKSANILASNGERPNNKAPRRDLIWLCGYAPKAWYPDGTHPNRWLLDGYSLKYGDSDNSFLTYPHIWGPQNSSRSILLKMVIGFSNSSLGPPICIPPIHKFPSGFAMGMFKQQKRTTHYSHVPCSAKSSMGSPWVFSFQRNRWLSLTQSGHPGQFFLGGFLSSCPWWKLDGTSQSQSATLATHISFRRHPHKRPEQK